MKKALLLVLFFLLLFSGCATWVMVEGRQKTSQDNFEVELPEGWRRYNLSWDALHVTRDGMSLQRLTIARVSVDRELAHTKKKLSPGMLPHEAAEVIVDNIRSNPKIAMQRILENSPARVGGRPGFKLLYSFKTQEGLTKKVAYYGALVGKWYYHFLYEAPARHYFDRDYPTFEKVRRTFKILGEASA